MKDYLKLSPEKAIPMMREELQAFLEQQNSVRVYSPNELFMLARMIEYLLVLVEQYQERLGS